MFKISIQLVSLACMGMARRLQTSITKWPHRHLAATESASETTSASLLRLVNPAAVFNPSGPEFRVVREGPEVRVFREAQPRHLRQAIRMSEDSGPDPQDWRAFRAKLISTGIRVTGEDGENIEEPKQVERVSVAPANEELLKQQDEDLWKEYLEGGWAHETSVPEVGGLVCRLSAEAQLTRLMRANPNESALVQGLYERLCSQLPSDVEKNSSSESEYQRLLKTWSSNTMYMYRMAEGFCREYDASFRDNVVDGVLDLSKVSDDLKEFIVMRINEQQEWQQVALVLDTGAGGRDIEATKCVVLNRPLRPGNGIERKLAELLLNGRQGKSPKLIEFDDAFVDRFLEAFGKKAAVYVGGTDNQGAPGTLIHGYDLPGATEIAPGTRIYSGGVKAAVEAVLAGERSPLDFRWFVGQLEGASVAEHEWCSMACARPIALKQCLGLPKPLWHEVLELCGDDLKSFSSIELLKRADLAEGNRTMSAFSS